MRARKILESFKNLDEKGWDLKSPDWALIGNYFAKVAKPYDNSLDVLIDVYRKLKRLSYLIEELDPDLEKDYSSKLSNFTNAEIVKFIDQCTEDLDKALSLSEKVLTAIQQSILPHVDNTVI